MAHYASHIRFLCPECGNENSDIIRVPETYWSGDNADERMAEDNTDTGCDACHKGFEIYVQNSDGRVNVTMLDYDDVEIKAGDAYMAEPDPDDYDYHYLFDVPSDPARFLDQTMRDTWSVLESARAIAESKTLYRMVFIQQYAALEAYLCDTLIGEVLRDPKALDAIIQNDQELKNKKYSLATILANPDVVKKEVVEHLRDQLYHNLPKVETVWQFTLDFKLFNDAEARDRLMKSMAIRHDCVHRNGKDKQGNTRTEVVWDFLSQMDTDIRSLMKHVEDNVSRRQREDDARGLPGT